MSLKIALQTIPLLLLALLVIAILIPACASNPDTTARVNEYKNALGKTAASSVSSTDGLEKFTTFLQKIGDKEYVKENTSKVYAPDAYLNDTIVTHNGTEDIKEYFLMTAETMSAYEVTIDDIASSGKEHYVRWTDGFHRAEAQWRQTGRIRGHEPRPPELRRTGHHASGLLGFRHQHLRPDPRSRRCH